MHFLLAGGIGFVVDAGVLTLLVQLAQWGPIVARGPSFLAAVTVTWLLNRRLAFRGLAIHRAGVEYRRYLLVQTTGALANLAIYAALIAWMPALGAVPVVPLCAGAVAGLVVNYTLSRRFVFPGEDLRS